MCFFVGILKEFYKLSLKINFRQKGKTRLYTRHIFQNVMTINFCLQEKNTKTSKNLLEVQGRTILITLKNV